MYRTRFLENYCIYCILTLLMLLNTKNSNRSQITSDKTFLTSKKSMNSATMNSDFGLFSQYLTYIYSLLSCNITHVCDMLPKYQIFYKDQFLNFNVRCTCVTLTCVFPSVLYAADYLVNSKGILPVRTCSRNLVI